MDDNRGPQVPGVVWRDIVTGSKVPDVNIPCRFRWKERGVKERREVIWGKKRERSEETSGVD